MVEYPLTKRELLRAIAYRDILRNKRLSDLEERERLARAAFQRLSSENPFSGGLRKTSLRGKPLVQFSGLEIELIARNVAKNLRANCRVEQSNRRVIVGNLISFLSEGCPYNVFRFDIKNFFENIDGKSLICRLLAQTKVPRKSIILLNKLFSEFKNLGVLGVPRGLGISSVLAEYVLEEFDETMRSHREIFFYGRFVDDIVIVASNKMTRETVTALVDASLPPPLSVHTEGGKVAAVNVGAVSENGHEPQKFEYLGYLFTVHSIGILGTLDIPARRVDVEIAEEKIEKIKSRVIMSFTDYLKSSKGVDDFRLLKDRIRALTGNYEIADATKKIPIKTGIFFNYSEKNIFENCALLRLDAFVRGLLFSISHQLSRRIQAALSLEERRILAGLTFSSGFHGKRFHAFDYKRLKQLKKVWRK